MKSALRWSAATRDTRDKPACTTRSTGRVTWSSSTQRRSDASSEKQDAPSWGALAQNYAPAVAYVSARLVVKHEHLHDFITNLKAEIRTRPASTRSGRHRYHSSFLLYTTVMQALTTGI